MRLQMPVHLGAAYASPSQRARVVSEGWGEENLYCPSCTSHRLSRSRANTPAIDFVCPECDSLYQLKSQAHTLSARISDAAYKKMRDAIIHGRTPSLLALHYDSVRWLVQDLILIPRFVFSMSCIERRNPLRPTAERHGHVLCNILLGNIPPDARIFIVTAGQVASPTAVRQQYARLRPLEKLGHEARGWTLDVLNVVRAIGREEFSLAEVYAFADTLRRLHPQNRHVEDKIRQQLQRLRDLGFLEFVGRGNYRLV